MSRETQRQTFLPPEVTSRFGRRHVMQRVCHREACFIHLAIPARHAQSRESVPNSNSHFSYTCAGHPLPHSPLGARQRIAESPDSGMALCIGHRAPLVSSKRTTATSNRSAGGGEPLVRACARPAAAPLGDRHRLRLKNSARRRAAATTRETSYPGRRRLPHSPCHRATPASGARYAARARLRRACGSSSCRPDERHRR